METGLQVDDRLKCWFMPGGKGTGKYIFCPSLIFLFSHALELLTDPVGNMFRKVVNKREELVGRHFMIFGGHMTTTTFDALAYFEKLKAAGVPEEQARVQANAFRDFRFSRMIKIGKSWLQKVTSRKSVLK